MKEPIKNQKNKNKIIASSEVQLFASSQNCTVYKGKMEICISFEFVYMLNLFQSWKNLNN